MIHIYIYIYTLDYFAPYAHNIGHQSSQPSPIRFVSAWMLSEWLGDELKHGYLMINC